MSTPEVLLLALLTSGIGALGGIGGAVILVPALVLSGMSAGQAAPLGLLSVAAGSLAAGPRQLQERTVNHRLGITTETAASTGAVVGALLAGALSDSFLTICLAVAALVAAAATSLRRDVEGEVIERPPDIDLGEERGALAGTYPVAAGATPYTATHLPAGLAVMTTAGLTAGLAGVSGGFIKTPTTTEIMKVPVKVAASTTTFTVGISAAAALVILLVHGRVDLDHASPVLVGSLVGGRIGALAQARFEPKLVRAILGGVLVAVSALLFAKA